MSNDFQLGRCKANSTVNQDRKQIEQHLLKDLNFQIECVTIAQQNEKGAELTWLRRKGLEEKTIKPTKEDKTLLENSLLTVREIYEAAVSRRYRSEENRDKVQLAYNKFMESDDQTHRPSERNMWYENEIPQMQWSHAPNYLSEFQPDKENPKVIYVQLVRALTSEAENVDHDHVKSLLERYK